MHKNSANEYTVHEHEHNGWKCVVVPDDSWTMDNPYHEYDPVTDVVSWMRSYDLNSTMRRGTRGQMESYAPYDGPDDVIAAYQAGEIVYYAPMYAYIHSGITVSLRRSYPYNDVWDSGLAGMVYVTKEKAAAEWPRLHNRTLWLACHRVAKDEVETLDQWLRGEVYGFRVLNPDGEEVDSCWGFLGDSEYCFEEAKARLQSSIDYAAKQARQEFLAQQPTLFEDCFALA